MRLSRPIPEGLQLKQVRVVRRASGYFAMLSLQSPVSVPDTPASGHPLGIDVGLDKFLATSLLVRLRCRTQVPARSHR